MNVCNCKSSGTEIKKKVFSLKPPTRDGLIQQIHHTVDNKCQTRCIRFLYATFDKSGLILANADIDGNVFIVDFQFRKYWSLPKVNSCSVLAFHPQHPSDLLIGCNDGTMYIINIHSGIVPGLLQGHSYPIKSISFANDQCLTASLTQAIIFDLKTLSKVHELQIECPTTLKQIFFMPVTNNIIACFSDDYIHVWKNTTFESFRKLLPTDWNKFHLKSIAVTRNGTTMVLGGISSKLIIFSLDTWSLTKILNLPNEITFKSIDFVSQAHDGGANKYLILLANNGIVHFLDMEQSVIIAKIQQCSEIISFAASMNGIHLACVLRSGEVNIYKLSYFIDSSTRENEGTCFDARGKMKLFLLQQKQPKEELNLNRLQGILKQYGEYPETYRALIWSKVLLLPGNVKNFSSINNKGYNPCFNQISRTYPLINKTALKNLQRLLSNLGNWCPIFCHLEFVPLFVFPFVKIFENDPLVCFETVITVVLNWCQHWFEYSPCIPANVLAIIENVLAEHDPQLLAHLTAQGITSQLYAWDLLEVAFSEVLTIKEWCILWDHVLSNEPAFLLLAVVAYNISSRSVLASFKSVEEFEMFYHNQNPIGIKKFISKTYYLLNNTSEKNHPRKYLKEFQRLPIGSYPVFEDYPKVMFDFDTPDWADMKQTEIEISRVESELSKYRESEDEKQKSFKIQEEETKRLQQLEDVYQDKVMQERERANQRKIQLSKLKTDLMEMQADSIEASRKKLEESNLNTRKRSLTKMLKTIEYNQAQNDLQIQQTEEDLSKHYVELLKQKTDLENNLLQSCDDDCALKEINEQREQLDKEMEEIRKNVGFNRMTNKIHIPLEISVINDKVQNADMDLASEMAKKQHQISQCQSNLQIIKMEQDTKNLENDVQSLLEQFASTKLHAANSAKHYLSNSVSQRKKLDKQWLNGKYKKNTLNCQCT